MCRAARAATGVWCVHAGARRAPGRPAGFALLFRGGRRGGAARACRGAAGTLRGRLVRRPGVSSCAGCLCLLRSGPGPRLQGRARASGVIPGLLAGGIGGGGLGLLFFWGGENPLGRPTGSGTGVRARRGRARRAGLGGRSVSYRLRAPGRRRRGATSRPHPQKGQADGAPAGRAPGPAAGHARRLGGERRGRRAWERAGPHNQGGPSASRRGGRGAAPAPVKEGAAPSTPGARAPHSGRGAPRRARRRARGRAAGRAAGDKWLRVRITAGQGTAARRAA
jgi:hypothetical protein